MTVDFTAARIARLDCSTEAKDCLEALRDIRGDMAVRDEITLMANWKKATPLELEELVADNPEESA